MVQTPFTSLDEYERQAESLLALVRAGNERAVARFKWELPRFKGKNFEETRTAVDTLTADDARTVIAREQSFDTWDELRAFVASISADGPVARFETAVDATVNGDLGTLRAMIEADPNLVHARSTRRHHCTLLHYIGANGVEGWRQKTPANAVEILKLLLDSGADPNSLADLYDHQCTTMSMLVSSVHPAEAGLQLQLAETLAGYGAKLDGAGTNWQSAVLTALTFGYRDTAEGLARRLPSIDDLPTAAGLGRTEDVARLLPSADAHQRHIALGLASQLGHAEVVRLLLDAGEDPNRYSPEGFHAHATPLHHAVWSEREDVVRLLVERGARLDVRDTIYSATPREWAEYGKKERIAEYLRSRE